MLLKFTRRLDDGGNGTYNASIEFLPKTDDTFLFSLGYLDLIFKVLKTSELLNNLVKL